MSARGRLDDGRADDAERECAQLDEAARGRADVARADRGEGGRVVEHVRGGRAEGVAPRRGGEGGPGCGVGAEVLGPAAAAVSLEGAHLDLEAVEVLGGRDAHAHAHAEDAAALRELEARERAWVGLGAGSGLGFV